MFPENQPIHSLALPKALNVFAQSLTEKEKNSNVYTEAAVQWIVIVTQTEKRSRPKIENLLFIENQWDDKE
jgi:hypothetical protein